jgi:NagD protein
MRYETGRRAESPQDRNNGSSVPWPIAPVHRAPSEADDNETDRIGFLLDMDGVIYRGHEAIHGAAQFVHRLREAEIPFLFLTNNSASAPRDYVIKLQKMGIEVEESHFYTCAMATVDFLRLQKPRATAFVIGEGGLVSALHQAGYGITEHHPDYVIVGEGRVLNFEMAEKATMMVRNGAHLIATNLDPSCPTATGIRPGCGALVALLEAATGVRAYSVGKPSPFMMRAARKRLGLRTGETVMIGDTMETDIRGGLELGFHTILVLTGSTERQGLARYPYQPSRVVESIAEVDPVALLEELTTAGLPIPEIASIHNNGAPAPGAPLLEDGAPTPLAAAPSR